VGGHGVELAFRKARHRNAGAIQDPVRAIKIVAQDTHLEGLHAARMHAGRCAVNSDPAISLRAAAGHVPLADCAKRRQKNPIGADPQLKQPKSGFRVASLAKRGKIGGDVVGGLVIDVMDLESDAGGTTVGAAVAKAAKTRCRCS
jgi:hypothetical protein